MRKNVRRVKPGRLGGNRCLIVRRSRREATGSFSRLRRYADPLAGSGPRPASAIGATPPSPRAPVDALGNMPRWGPDHQRASFLGPVTAEGRQPTFASVSVREDTLRQEPRSIASKGTKRQHAKAGGLQELEPPAPAAKVGTLIRRSVSGLKGGVAEDQRADHTPTSGCRASSPTAEQVDSSVPGWRATVDPTVLHYEHADRGRDQGGFQPVPPLAGPPDAPAVQDFPHGNGAT